MCKLESKSRPAAALFICFLLNAQLAGALEPVWAGVEIIAAPEVDTTRIREAVNIQIGGEISSWDDAKKNCDHVKAALLSGAEEVASRGGHPLVASCELVGFPRGQTYFVINVTAVRPTPQPSKMIATGDARLGSDLAKLAREYLAERASLVSSSALFFEGVDGSGILWAGVEALDHKKKSQLPFVQKHEEEILQCVLLCGDSEDRAAATELLGWIPTSTRTMQVALGALGDSDPPVRNNASRYIRFRLTSFLSDESMVRSLARSAAKQTSMPSHGDRNKGLFMLNDLARIAPAVVACEAKEHWPWIEYLASTSVLPNIGGEAKRLLESLDGQANRLNCANQ